MGDGAASPVASSIKFFRDEYVAHIEGNGCPFDPKLSMLAANGADADDAAPGDDAARVRAEEGSAIDCVSDEEERRR